MDSSALFKRYHRESGTEKLEAIYGGKGRIYISELACLELASTAARKRRSGAIDTRTFESIIARFTSDIGPRIEGFSFSPVVLDGAYKFLVESHGANPLKTLDALQFSFYRENCKPDTVYVSSDQRLLGVVRSYGFPVLNPESS